jgi:hypothetical protein
MSPQKMFFTCFLFVFSAQLPAQALYYFGDPNIKQGQLIPLSESAQLPTKKSVAELPQTQDVTIDITPQCVLLFKCHNVLLFKSKNNSFEFKFKEKINFPLLENSKIITADKKWTIESNLQSEFISSRLEYDYTPEKTVDVCARSKEYCKFAIDIDSEGQCKGEIVYECLEHKPEIVPESKTCYLEKYYDSHYEMTISDEHQKPIARYLGNIFKAKDSTKVELDRCGR